MKESYVAYEYKSINVKSDLEPMYIDYYENFGWNVINNEKKDYYINSNPNPNVVNIKFKRNRKIKNREKLNELQNKCEKAFLMVDKLEKQPSSQGTINSLTVAFIGTIFMAISVFAISGEKLYIVPFLIGGALGIIGWILPYFVYKNTKNKLIEENKTKIEEQENIIYDTCEQARKILDDEE